MLVHLIWYEPLTLLHPCDRVEMCKSVPRCIKGLVVTEVRSASHSHRGNGWDENAWARGGVGVCITLQTHHRISEAA